MRSIPRSNLHPDETFRGAAKHTGQILDINGKEEHRMKCKAKLLEEKVAMKIPGTPYVCHASMQREIKVGVTEAEESTRGIRGHNNRVTILAKRNIGGLKYEEVKSQGQGRGNREEFQFG